MKTQNIRTRPILHLKEAFDKQEEVKKTKIEQKEKKQITFDEFLDGVKKVSEAGVKIIDIFENITNIKDQLENITYDDLEIKRFGVGGSHITLPSEFIGKKAKVIIKK
jgi:putative transposon-encoded protein